MSELVLVLGGARSGKSAFARRLASRGDAPVLVVATMEPGDEELRRRVERHRRERPATWRTVEEPLDVVEAMRPAEREATVLLDCLTLWVANLLQVTLGEDVSPEATAAAEQEVLRRMEELIAWQREWGATLVIVSNEVGQGIVPEYPLGRAFRDVLGLAHQRIAAAADRVYFVTAGLANEIKNGAISTGE